MSIERFRVGPIAPDQKHPLLCGSGALAAWVAMRVWPSKDPHVLERERPDVLAGHAHVGGAVDIGDRTPHDHPYVVDDLHPPLT